MHKINIASHSFSPQLVKIYDRLTGCCDVFRGRNIAFGSSASSRTKAINVALSTATASSPEIVTMQFRCIQSLSTSARYPGAFKSSKTCPTVNRRRVAMRAEMPDAMKEQMAKAMQVRGFSTCKQAHYMLWEQLDIIGLATLVSPAQLAHLCLPCVPCRTRQ